MTDNKKPNDPFESHIESDAFDVSHLDDVPMPKRVDDDIRAFLERLPAPTNPELWDTMLDDEQRRICAHLTTELVKRVARDSEGNALAEVPNEQLVAIYRLPVMLGMLAERELHAPAPPPAPEPHPLQESPSLPHTDYSHLWASLQEGASRVYRRVKDAVIRFYDRMTR